MKILINKGGGKIKENAGKWRKLQQDHGVISPSLVRLFYYTYYKRSAISLFLILFVR